MKREGVYYLARISKMGTLTDELIAKALLSPKPVVLYGNAWSFVDTAAYETDGVPYIVGRLVKYRPDAEVIIVDPQMKTEHIQQEPNMRLASSTFIYLPNHAGVAFLRVSGHIEPWHFIKRFASIIEETYDRFFVECTVNMISDLKSFAMKLSNLSGITRISAVVVPPNPLFGPLWKPLRDYIKERRSGQMVIREDSKSKQPLNTDLAEIVTRVSKQEGGAQVIPEKEIPIGDAAVLMAADGYGSGLIKGISGGAVVVIRTADTNRNFVFDKEPSAEELFKKVSKILDHIKNDRHLEHQ